MSIFDAYDQEYNGLSRDTIKAIGELKALPPGSEKVGTCVRHVDALISQSVDLIKQMEIEVRSHDAGTRKALGEKVTEYKKSLSNLRSDFERAKESSQRSSLIGDKSSNDRQRLLDVNDKYGIIYFLMFTTPFNVKDSLFSTLLFIAELFVSWKVASPK